MFVHSAVAEFFRDSGSPVPESLTNIVLWYSLKAAVPEADLKVTIVDALNEQDIVKFTINTKVCRHHSREARF